MYVVRENTADRLAIEIGSFPDWAVFALDRATARMKVERKRLFWRRKPLDLAFVEIRAFDTLTTTVKKAKTEWIVLVDRTGKHHYCAGFYPNSGKDAVSRMSAFIGL